MPTIHTSAPRAAQISVLISGIFCASLGVVVVVGWHLGSARVVQIHPAWAPMQYNTALGFVACGVGMVARALGLVRVCTVAGTFAALLGGLTLAEYLSHQSIGLDELFFNHYITTASSHAGRMAPNTALCFSLVGAALFVAARKKRSPMCGPILGGLGSIVTALAAVALTGYVTGIAAAYGWGQLTRMAAHTAGGFLMLGVGITTYAWHIDKPSDESIPAWLPAPVALGMSVIALLTWQSLIVDNQQQTMLRVEDSLRSASLAVERRLDSVVAELTAAGAHWADHAAQVGNTPAPEDAHWLAPHTDFEAFGWVDASGQLVAWLALASDSDPGSTSPPASRVTTLPAVRRATKLRRAQLSDRLRLPSGRPGLLVAAPARSGSGRHGVAVALADTAVMLTSTIEAAHIPHSVSVVGDDGEAMFDSRLENEHHDERFGRTADLDVHGLHWKVRVVPTRAWLTSAQSSTPDVVLAAGLLIALALARICYMAYQVNRRSVELRTSEARWQHLFEHAPGAHVLTDRRGGVIDLNQAALELIAIDRDDAIGRRLDEIGALATDDVERLREAWSDLEAGGPPVALEFVIRTRPRNPPVVDLHLYPTRIEDEDLVLGVFHDVTERRRALLEMQRRLDFERVVTGLASIFINLPTTDIDSAIEDLLGRVASFAHADRACMVRVPGGGEPFEMVHEWHVPGARSFAADVVHYNRNTVGPIVRQLTSGETVHVDDVTEAYPDPPSGESWASEGAVGSFIAVPLHTEGRLDGYVGFSTRVAGSWDSDHIAVMKVAAELVVNVLARRDAEATLQASEERFRQIADNIDAAFFVYQLDPPAVLYASPAIETVWGIPQERAMTEPMSITELMAPGDAEMMLNGYSAAEHGQQEMEYRITRPDGARRWLHTRAFPVADPSGRVYRIAGITSDITARKDAEERLAYRADFESLIRSLAANLITGDVEHMDQAIEEGLGNLGRMLGVDRAVIYMLSPDWTRASNTHEWCAEETPSLQGQLQDFECDRFPWLGERTVRGEVLRIHSIDDLPEDADAERYAFTVAGVRSRIQLPLRYSGGRIGALTFISVHETREWTDDVTVLLEMAATVFSSALERKLADENVEHYRDKLRVLASEVSLAEERERRRIAADLHDRTIQNLGLCKMQLGELQRALDEDGDMTALASTRSLLQDTIRDARTLAFEISSPVLYELGFRAAVEWLAERMEDMHGIPFSVEDDGIDKPLDDDIAVVLFQAVRELMANIGKHARASRAAVRLSASGSTLRIEVADDGRGFDPSSIGPRLDEASGFGLFSIRERSHLIGGDLVIDSNPEHGTRIVLRAPLTIQTGASA